MRREASILFFHVDSGERLRPGGALHREAAVKGESVYAIFSAPPDGP